MDARIEENLQRLGIRASEVQSGHYEEAREDDLDVPECVLELMFDLPWNDEGPFFAQEGEDERTEVLFLGPEEFDEELDPDTVEEYGEFIVFAQLAGEELFLMFQADDALDDPVFYLWESEAAGSDDALSELGDFDNLLSCLHGSATQESEEGVSFDELDPVSDLDFEDGL